MATDDGRLTATAEHILAAAAARIDAAVPAAGRRP